MESGMYYLITVTLLALITQFIFSYNVWKARITYKIDPPKISWNNDFERIFRVHYNTLENIVIFLPLFWIAGITSNAVWVSFLWLWWIFSRIMYAKVYYKAVEWHLKPFFVGLIFLWLLMLTILFELISTWVFGN